MSIKDTAKQNIGTIGSISERDWTLLGKPDELKSSVRPDVLSGAFGGNPRLHELIADKNKDFLMDLFLKELNEPLIKAELAHPFNREDVIALDPDNTDVPVKTVSTESLGDGYAMAMIQSTRGQDKTTGEWRHGWFAPVFQTNKEYKEAGAKNIVLTNPDATLPQGEVQGRITITPELHKEVNEKLTQYGRPNLSDSIVSNEHGPNEVVDFKFHPEDQDKYSLFYKRFQLGLTLKKADSSSVGLITNRLGENGRQGEINMVMFDDQTVAATPSIRFLPGSTPRLEINRGYGNPNTKELTKKLQEMGYQYNASELSQEMGLNEADALALRVDPMQSDHRFEMNSISVVKYVFPKESVVKAAPKEVQLLLDEFESTGTTLRLDSKEWVDAIRDGLTIDAFTLSTLGSLFLSNGEWRINPAFQEKSVVFERRFVPQFGKIVDVLPVGPAEGSGGTKLAVTQSNTGATRVFNPIFGGGMDMLRRGPMYSLKAMPNVQRDIVEHKLTNVDSGSLTSGFLKSRVIIHKSEKF